MKTRLLLLSAGLLLASLASQAQIQTLGSAVNPANNHTYYVLSYASWTDSEAFAQTLGGHLATVNDYDETLWIFNTFPSMTGSSHPDLWIGLNDAAVEGTWVWVSGDMSTYRYWYPSEPNNIGDEDYAFIRAPQEAPPYGSWGDFNNTGGGAAGNVFGIVEVVPEPQAFALLTAGATALLAARWKRV